MVKIRIDVENCDGCMICVEVCPEFFGSIESHVETIAKEVPAEFADKCYFAAGLCPSGAIELSSHDWDHMT
jgi:ferredoxin